MEKKELQQKLLILSTDINDTNNKLIELKKEEAKYVNIACNELSPYKKGDIVNVKYSPHKVFGDKEVKEMTLGIKGIELLNVYPLEFKYKFNKIKSDGTISKVSQNIFGEIISITKLK